MFIIRHYIIIFSIIIISLMINTGCNNLFETDEEIIPLNIEILEDKNSNISFDNITGNKYSFMEIRDQNKNIGFTSSSWWVKVSVRDGIIPEGEYVVVYNQYWTNTVDAYISSENGYLTYNAGNEHGFNARPIRDRIFAFPVTVKGRNPEIYLKLGSPYRIVLDIKLLDRETYLKRRSIVEPFYAVLIAFLIYNLIFFFFIKAKVFLFYCGFLFTFLLFLLSFDGTGFMYLWSDSPEWNDFTLTAMLILQSFWAILFFIKFTGSELFLPRTTKFLYILALLTIPAASLKLFFPAKNVIFWNLPLLQLIALTLISISLYMAVKGSRSAAYFLISFILLLGFSLANSLTSYGLIDDNYIVHVGMHIGVSVCAVTFSFGMADRINSMRILKELSEKTVKAQNSKLEKTNEELDATNQELQAAMEELEAANEEFQAIMDELQKSNQLLWDSEQRLAGVVDRAPVGISITDINGHLLQINDYALSRIGYRKEEIIGKSFNDITCPEDISKGEELYSLLISGKIESYRYDKRFIRKDGLEWWADVSASPIKNEAGEITAIIGVALDINDKINARKEHDRIQNQLWQVQKLEAVGTLAGGIAHDFNNILSVIMGYTELAIADTKDGVCSEENLQHILNSSKRARDIVWQILTLSRKGDNTKIPLKITPLIEETIKLIRATIPSTITINFSDNSDTTIVLCDATQVQQVLLNLCTNASHAMGENGGTLTVNVGNEIIGDPMSSIYRISAGKFIFIKVSDTGTGMNSDILERIFEPFFTTKSPGIGTGLGLSVARGIITDHGGFITAESEEGKGSAFTVYLPVAPEADESDKENVKTDSLPGGSESLLIVDDESIIAEMIKLILQKLGYTVKTASGSMEALEMIRTSPGEFDLVITDQTMPQMTGMSLAREIKVIRPDLPVILCTGYSDTADPEKAREYGISEFLYKPVLTEDLADAIRRVLG